MPWQNYNLLNNKQSSISVLIVVSEHNNSHSNHFDFVMRLKNLKSIGDSIQIKALF